MVLKRTIAHLVIVFALSGAFLFHGGCSKPGGNEKASEQGKGAGTEMTEPKTQAVLPQNGDNPVVLMETSLGKITIELFPKEAPVTVKNFLDYVHEGFYDGTIFHRVVPNFVIQGGGFTEDMNKKATRSAITNEAKKGLCNTRGTIAMARTFVVNSATSQFFINLTDNPSLDQRDETSEGYGYCVFGRVIEGMDVVDTIARVPTTRRAPHDNVPIKPVVIKSARLLGQKT